MRREGHDYIGKVRWRGLTRSCLRSMAVEREGPAHVTIGIGRTPHGAGDGAGVKAAGGMCAGRVAGWRAATASAWLLRPRTASR